eukprot:6174424-Pleurochrysis_carterae.AAC.2
MKRRSLEDGMEARRRTWLGDAMHMARRSLGDLSGRARRLFEDGSEICSGARLDLFELEAHLARSRVVCATRHAKAGSACTAREHREHPFGSVSAKK